MSITAQIVADSISSQGIRLSTLSLKYPAGFTRNS